MRKIYSGTLAASTSSSLASTLRFFAFTLLICLAGYTGWAAPNTVCMGQSFTLAGGGSGGYWVSNNSAIAKVTPQTGIVTGVNEGKAIVYYRLPTGVILTNTITVLPLAQTTGLPVLCQGVTTLLKNKTPAGGVWTTNSNAIATVSQNGMLTGTGGGIAIVTFTSLEGCIATKTVTINGTQPITGNNIICVAETTTLANTVPGGRWISSSGAIAPVTQAGVVKGVHAGLARISYITTEGCYTTSSVTVLPLAGTTTAGLTHICQDQTTLLVNSTPFGGTWTSSDNSVAQVSSDGHVTGMGSGSVVISFTSVNGCTTLKTMSVTAIAPITGVMSVCVGQTTTLSNAIPGGRWSTGAGALDVAITQGGVIKGISAAERTRILYIWPSGCQSVATVQVRPLQPIRTIASTPNLCMNMSIQLLNATVGTGTWTSSNNTIAQVASDGTLSGISGGSAIITYATDQACITTMSVNVIQTQPITGTMNTCVGQQTTLANSAVLLGGLWSSSSASLAKVNQDGVVTGVSAGTARISFINPYGCHSVAYVSVYALSPITGSGSSCLNKSFALRNNTPFGGTWSSSNVGIAGVTPSGLVTTTSSAGLVTISFTSAASGCVATRTVRVYNCFREGQADDDNNDPSLADIASANTNIELYPNPNTGNFTLKGSLGSLANPGTDESATVEVMNMLGQVISSSSIMVQNASINAPIQLDGNLPAGSYMLNMRTANGSKLFRFTIQR